MSTLVVPEWPKRKAFYPSLGPQVYTWMRENLVYGPGDLRGQPLQYEAEFEKWLYWCYLLNPKGAHRAGKRVFNRAAFSVRKGLAKTEKAALIACCELCEDAPVRFAGWDSEGKPVGQGVIDPYIPMVAYTEDQTEELAYGAVKFILENSKVADDFDIGMDRIMRADGRGKLEAIATTPDASDGARTTFEHFDETHRLVLPRHVETHQVMLQNLVKRPLADPWALETTTAFTPGEGSVAEGTMDYATQIHTGKIKNSRLFFFHRGAGDSHDLDTREGKIAAVIEASGPFAAQWSDVEGIVDMADNPQTDKVYWQRVWLNQIKQSAQQAFDLELWDSLTRPEVVPEGSLVVLGFDGSRVKDATAIVGTVVDTGYQFVLGAWERPEGQLDWEVDRDEVNDIMDFAFKRFDIWRLYADPPYWEDEVDRWGGRYGKEHVIEWWTLADKKMAWAIRKFTTGMRSDVCLNDGDARFRAHMGNAVRKVVNVFDEDGVRMHTIRKERQDSPFKIDIAMAAILSWEARGDCLAAGSPRRRRKRAMTVFT